MPHDRAGLEPPQLQCVEVELRRRLGIRGEQHLKAPVEAEAVDHVGTRAAADVVGCLDDHHVTPGFVHYLCGREASKAGTDDDDIGALGQRPMRGQEAARPRTMLTPLCVGTPSAGSIDTSTIGYLAGSTPDGMV